MAYTKNVKISRLQQNGVSNVSQSKCFTQRDAIGGIIHSLLADAIYSLDGFPLHLLIIYWVWACLSPFWSLSILWYRDELIVGLRLI